MLIRLHANVQVEVKKKEWLATPWRQQRVVLAWRRRERSNGSSLPLRVAAAQVGELRKAAPGEQRKQESTRTWGKWNEISKITIISNQLFFPVGSTNKISNNYVPTRRHLDTSRRWNTFTSQHLYKQSGTSFFHTWHSPKNKDSNWDRPSYGGRSHQELRWTAAAPQVAEQ
jgi:hypothetical protein